MRFDLILPPLIISFIVSVILTPLTIFLAKFLKIVDDPKTHKHPAILHTKPIPRAGGIPIFLAIFTASLLFMYKNTAYFGMFSGAMLALIVGVIDDKFDISPYIRLTTNLICAIILVACGVTIPSFITNPFGGVIHFNFIYFAFNLFGLKILIHLSDLIALFWIIWVMNMLNWSKGVDGQMPGVIAISAFIIGILSLRFPVLDRNSISAAYLSFAIAGASLGFLIYNFHPAKIFPGYGTTSVYLLLAAASMLSSAKIATGFIVLAVPMIDGTFTIFRRVLSGKSMFWGDKKHLHHMFLTLGYSQRQIAIFYWLMTLILGIFALSLTGNLKVFAIIFLVFIFFGFLLFLHFLIDKNER